MLSYWLNVELSYRLSMVLSEWLSFLLTIGLSFGWLLFLCGWFVLWAAMSGLTILRHYTLRLLLARSHTFPLQARRFLDDATARTLLRRVGGGYGFVHRRLLDYFANVYTSATQGTVTTAVNNSVPQTLSDTSPIVQSSPSQ